MIPKKGKTYYIDYHEGPEYCHYHGNGLCVNANAIDMGGPCYAFRIPGQEDWAYFPEEAIINVCSQQ